MLPALTMDLLRHNVAVLSVSVRLGAGSGVLALLLWGSVGRAQSVSELPQAPSRATPVPLSGRQGQAGDVTVMQRTTNSGGSNSVDVINSTVTVPPPYSGSVPQGLTADGTISLTLDAALAMGLRANLGALDQAANVQQAQGQRLVARSELMPQLNTVVSEAFEKINLRTLGVQESSFPLTSKFNYYDARALRLNQSVLDFVRIRNFRGATEVVEANVKAARNARDLIVLAVGGSYLQLLATGARVQAAQANVTSFQAIYKQAADRLAAGLATRVDADRSQVQLQTEQQRLRSLQADEETQKLRLARLIGLPVDQAYAASDRFPFAPVKDLTEAEAMKRAMANRSDLQAAEAGVRAAEVGAKAASAERLPTVNVTADFGAAGTTPTHQSAGVYTVYGTLNIPIYQGGRVRGDEEVANAALTQRKAELADQRAQVQQDIRQAYIDLRSAADQVGVAQSNVTLAHESLAQSRDRFAAGVADSVELVQAEQTVVQADDDAITATFEHNLAKVSLARSMGDAEQSLPQQLRK